MSLGEAKTAQRVALGMSEAPGVLRGRVAGPAPYAPMAAAGPIDLYLDANEGPRQEIDVAAVIAGLGGDDVRRYPGTKELEGLIAERCGVASECVLVTAGGDEAIDRICRACLGPGREVVLPVPTFEMIGRYARLAGGSVVTTPWPEGSYPTDAVIEKISDRTGLVAMVSPNNPTGAVATGEDLRRVAAAAAAFGAVVMLDLAYAEFCDEDLQSAARAMPNVVAVRTFSKAYGLAGIRVGYSVGDAALIRACRAAGAPYPVSAVSVALAKAALLAPSDRLRASVARVRAEREELTRSLAELGVRSVASQANFVLGEFGDAEWVWRSLASLGIAVRRFAPGSGLDRSLRISCPGEGRGFERLLGALRTAMAPEALLLDMDGVIADVSRSYRRAIVMTAAGLGVTVTPADVAAAKARGHANNDWDVTHRLVRDAGVEVSLDAITARFEAIYQGADGRPGLEAQETLLAPIALFERLAARLPLGIVTGRPRADCDRFLDRFGLRPFFRAVVCMEDAPIKPDPAPVRFALERLGVRHAWMVGDTRDDTDSARGAGVVPIGVVAPGDDVEAARRVLEAAGIARVLGKLDDLEAMIP